jgi:hypothetical protein
VIVPTPVWLLGLGLLLVDFLYGATLLYFAIIMFLVVVLMMRNAVGERREVAAYVVVGAMTIFVLVEFASAYYWVTSAVAPTDLFGVASQDLETNLTYSAYSAAPVLLLLVMFSWVWAPILERSKLAHGILWNHPPTQVNVSRQSVGLEKRLFVAALDLLVIVSVLVFYFCYAAGQMWIVGVDSYWRYLIPLNGLKGQSVYQAILGSLNLYHGLYVGLLYVVQQGTGLSSFSTVKFAPLILSFATSSFVFLAFRTARSFALALLSALCAVFWLPTTLGIWGGIQANWVAYALWMLFLVSYLQTSGKWRVVRFVVQGLLSLGILVLHPWTWGVFLATVVVAELIIMRHRAGLRYGMLNILSAVWLAIPVGVGAFIYAPGVRGDFASATSIYFSSFAHSDMLLVFSGAWQEMFRTWSSFLSPALIVLALFGAFSLTKLEPGVKRYMVAWVAVWCVGSFLVAPLGYVPAHPAHSETQLWRMLYLSPLPILLALGVTKIVDLSSRLKLTLPDQVTWVEPTVLLGLVGAFSIPLFIITLPLMRLALLAMGAVSVLLLTYKVQVGTCVRVMVLAIVMLIIVNAAFRSLFPLLIDPHNLYPLTGL